MKNFKVNQNLIKTKAARLGTRLSLAAVITAFSVSPVLAATESVLDNIEMVLKTYYGRLSAIAIGTGLLAAVVAVIIMVVSPSDRGAEKGKSWLVRILIGIALLLSIGGIYSFIQSMTATTTLDMNTIIK